MATSTERARARERIARACRHAATARELRADVLDQLRHAIGFDSYVFVLTDPKTWVGCDPLADVPLLHDLPRLIRLKYVTGVNRWTVLGEPPVGLLHEGTAGRCERSPLWRDLLGPAGIVDVASVVFRDRYGCWGFLDLWRAAPATPFTGADAGFLGAVAPAVTGGIRRCQAATFAERPVAPAGARTPLVLLLSPELAIRAQTRQTQDYLRRLLPTAAGQSPVPAAAYNVAAQLAATEAGVDDHPPAARVHLAGGAWVALRAARIGDGPEHLADIAVTIEHCSPAERLDIVARACALSAREAELLAVLAEGADTRRAAERMCLSPHTVQDHLKSIFAKMDVRTRRELLARALG